MAGCLDRAAHFRRRIDHRALLNFALALVGTLLLAIAAKMLVPSYPVSMTMQNFVVLTPDSCARCILLITAGPFHLIVICGART